jgi:hypothetical protein
MVPANVVMDDIKESGLSSPNRPITLSMINMIRKISKRKEK